jgi:hypothetical protein
MVVVFNVSVLVSSALIALLGRGQNASRKRWCTTFRLAAAPVGYDLARDK